MVTKTDININLIKISLSNFFIFDFEKNMNFFDNYGFLGGFKYKVKNLYAFTHTACRMFFILSLLETTWLEIWQNHARIRDFGDWQKKIHNELRSNF